MKTLSVSLPLSHYAVFWYTTSLGPKELDKIRRNVFNAMKIDKRSRKKIFKPMLYKDLWLYASLTNLSFKSEYKNGRFNWC